jgi:hypothetical protein
MARWDVQRELEDAARNRDRSQDANKGWGNPDVQRAAQAQAAARAHNHALATGGNVGAGAFDGTSDGALPGARPTTGIAQALPPGVRRWVREQLGISAPDLAHACGLPMESVVEAEKTHNVDKYHSAGQYTEHKVPVVPANVGSPLYAGYRKIVEECVQALPADKVKQLNDAMGWTLPPPVDPRNIQPSSAPMGRPYGQ